MLPGEVLLEIFESISHAPSQIAFALTCKRVAALARSIDLARTLTSAKYAGFLPVGVFDIPDLMASLRSWNPASLRLCGHCLTFRPGSAEYWQGKKGYERSDFWIQKIGWSFKGMPRPPLKLQELHLIRSRCQLAEANARHLSFMPPDLHVK
jgi:hypothetical protein